MGQCLSAPRPSSDVQDFINLPKEAIEALWTSYNLLGEGWGLSEAEVIAIFNGAPFVAANLTYAEDQLKKLFKAFDTDSNGLIDALEMCTAVALVSGMDSVEKIHFCFCAFDFDCAGMLSYDEVTLMLRSAAKGLGKICPSNIVFTTPTAATIEKYTSLMFIHSSKSVESGDRITLKDCVHYCSTHPVVSSWLRAVSNFPSSRSDYSARLNLMSGDILSVEDAAFESQNESEVCAQLFEMIRTVPAPQQEAVMISESDYLKLEALKESARLALLARKPKATDILKDEDDADEGEPQEETKASPDAETEDKSKSTAIEPGLPAWVAAVNLMQPEEMPDGIRTDNPEDVFEAFWLSGVNCSRSSVLPLDTVTEIPVMHRCVRYGPTPAAPLASEDDGGPDEGGAAGPITPILYSSAQHVIQMKKSNEIGWVQSIYSGHGSSTVTAIDINKGKNLIASGDTSGFIVIWDLTSFATLQTFKTVISLGGVTSEASRGGVKFLDLSSDGRFLLVVTNDLAATTTIYDLNTTRIIFSKPLLLGAKAYNDSVLDIRFTGSSKIFVAAFSRQELTYFVDEGNSFMGDDGLLCYEERTALYQVVGQPAIGAATTEICRFEQEDEVVTGTEKGQVLLWRGRSCSQLLDAHNAPITALDFNASTLTLLSGAANGTVNIYTMVSLPNLSPGKRARGPTVHTPRMLQLSASFDVLNQDLCCFSLRSIEQSLDSTKALLSTGAGEVLEVALVVTPLTSEEIAELEAAAVEAADAANAAAAAEAEEGVEVPQILPESVPTTKGNIGDNIHGGTLLAGHFDPVGCSSTGTDIARTPHITCVCRMVGGGFVSCAVDGTVRIWQGTGGSEETGPTSYTTTKVLKMDSGCSKVDASSNFIAVALDGSAPNSSRKGSIHVFSLPEAQFIIELTEPKQTIVDLKLNPEGTFLAAACEDGAIYVYQQSEGVWTSKGIISSPSGGKVANLVDFSTDGAYLRSFYRTTCTLRIWDIAGSSFGKDIVDQTAVVPTPQKDPDTGDELPPDESANGPPMDLLRGLTWHTHSCAYNWDTKGCRSIALTTPNVPNAIDRFNHILVSALGDGSIGIDRVPAVQYRDTAEGMIRFPAHVGAVAALTFIDEGARLVTAGATDGTICVWRVHYDTDEFEPDILPGAEENAGEAIEEEGEEEEGKPKLEILYDSGEDDDFIDGDRMKEHLSRDNVKKRATFKIVAEEAMVRFAEVNAAAEEAELTKADETSDEAKGSEEKQQVGAAEYRSPYSEEELAIDKLSGVKFWAESGLGLKPDRMAGECRRALAAAPSFVPHDELQLSWVYGCSTRSVRRAVHYSATGAVVYPAGTIGIVYDKILNTQIHAAPHCDEITALDVHVESERAVSGHRGTGDIEVVLWSTVNGSLIRSFTCGEVNGVSALKFSRDGEYMAVACQDANHTTIVFNCKTGKRCAEVQTGPKKALCLAFSFAPSTPGAQTLRILQGGVLHFKLLTFHVSGGQLMSKSGSYGADVRKSNVLCAAALPLHMNGDGEVNGNEFVMGLSDGSVGLLSKNESKVSVFNPVHKGPVTAIAVATLKDGTADEPPVLKIVTGGINGQLKVLDQELQPLAEFNLYLPDRGLQPLGRLRGFKSIAVDKLNRKILYGTAGGEIGEIDIETGVEVNEEKGVLVHSHFRDSLYALSAHPLRQECVTAGDDKTIRIWNLDDKRMLTSIQLPDIARAVAFSPNGHLIVAGMGGEVSGGDLRNPREHNGKVAVVSYLQGMLRTVHLTSDAKDAISSVIFTPDGSKMLAASLDGEVYVYDALNNFQLIITLSGHKEGVKSIDISSTGQYVVSMGMRTELFCWDLNTGTRIETPDGCFETLATVGMEWYVRQNPFGISSLGVFPPFSDPMDVQSVHQSQDATLMVTGDSFGALKLFKNPVCDLFAPCREYFGHSPGGVSKVEFSFEDEFVLSIGRSDRVMLQWKVNKSAVPPDSRTFETLTQSQALTAAQDSEGSFADSFSLKGVDLMASKGIPEVGSTFQSPLQVQLQGLFGTGNDQTSEYRALPTAKYFGFGDVLTCFGKVPALLEGSAANIIRPVWMMPAVPNVGVTHYNNPLQSMITVIVVSPSGLFALIGQRNNQLFLVSAPSGKLVRHLRVSGDNDSKCEIVAASFAPSNRICASISKDDQHSLHVFRTLSGDWTDAMQLSRVQLSAACVDLIAFLRTTVQDSFDIVTAGRSSHIKFWQICGQNLHGQCGDFGEESAPSKLVFTALEACNGGAHFSGCAVAGDAEGCLHLWRAGKKMPNVEAHGSCVTALKAFKDGFASASNDKIILWSTSGDDETFKLSKSISIPSILSSCSGWSSALYTADSYVNNNFVTSLDCDPRCERLLVSFSSSPIVSVATDSLNAFKVCEGHGRSAKVVGIVAHPSEPCTVLTITEDRMLRVWDLAAINVEATGTNVAPVLVGALNLLHSPSALAFLNDNTLLVAISKADSGGQSGAVLVVHMSSAEIQLQGLDMKFRLTVTSRIHNVGNGPITSLCFAPKNKFLAACSSDGCVYIYSVDENGLVSPSSNPSAPNYEEKFGDAVSSTSDSDVSADAAFSGIGFLLAHPTGTPVAAMDFSSNGRYARTFGANHAAMNAPVEVNYFDFEMKAGEEGDENKVVKSQHAAVKVVEPMQIEAIRDTAWASCNSPVAPELRALNYMLTGDEAGSLRQVTDHVLGPDKEWVCASYADGSSAVYRFPANDIENFRNNNSLRATLSLHSETGPVLCTYTAGSVIDHKDAKLVTVSQADGTMMAWKVSNK